MKKLFVFLVALALSAFLTTGSVQASSPVSVWTPGVPVVMHYASGQESSPASLTYKVAAQNGFDAEEFASVVEPILSDVQSWKKSAMVSQTAKADVTINLVSPGITGEKCGDSVIYEGEIFLSCSTGPEIWINAERWFNGSPLYPGDLQSYRTYLINHEVGHSLGHGHEKCPGVGELANVMQQQTLGLNGCTLNPWPWNSEEEM